MAGVISDATLTAALNSLCRNDLETPTYPSVVEQSAQAHWPVHPREAGNAFNEPGGKSGKEF
ncbi:MAG: hypothetical protein B7X53_01260 [Hyphomonas sp. 34-62-18]|nr:hypothetical protein [Hyphomonas sp. 34-62-18]OZB19128.1 MAG: hypothetical protein B7X53_01260 [Hyphomonas sp. 34-62-18]